jgi:hypothetical protein
LRYRAINVKRPDVRPLLTESIVDYEIRSGLTLLDWLTTEIEFHQANGAVAEVAALIEEATEVAAHVYALIARATPR